MRARRRLRAVDNGREHIPAQLLPHGFPSYPIHDEDAFYSFWSEDVAGVLGCREAGR